MSVDEALRHLRAIPAGAPEQEYVPRLTAALNAPAVAAAAARQAAQYLGQYVKNLGYDVSVQPSETAGQLTIASREFGDSDHRVRFLDMPRSLNGPQTVLCADGIAKVTLKTQCPLFGFQETYGLWSQ